MHHRFEHGRAMGLKKKTQKKEAMSLSNKHSTFHGLMVMYLIQDGEINNKQRSLNSPMLNT